VQFFIDNNLPQPLAEALHALSAPKGYQVVHLKQKFTPSTPDTEWIESLSKESDWVVITQDHLRKGDLEKEAFRQSELVAFFLTRQWAHHLYWDKAHQLVRWWPAIIEQSQFITGGAAFKVPWRFSGKGKFEQVRI